MSVASQREAVDRLDFRDIHPNLRFGTASDRYAGWIGQIYSESYRSRVSKRRRTLGKESYEERTVPIESVAEYFDHFDALELDFTFYRPLAEATGEPTSNYHVLSRYAEHAPDNATFFLKAPRAFFSPRLRARREGRTVYVDNPEFLDADAYVAQFHRPAIDLLNGRLRGIIFEQEYQRRSQTPPIMSMIESMDRFFVSIPRDCSIHLELRSQHLLESQYFDWLETCGLGFVFSHWTWLPPIRKQWKICGERFSSSEREVVLRLLTPLNVSYADAYAKTHPFDEVVPEIAESEEAHRMIVDTVALAYRAIEDASTLNVITNNRAYGNAPELTRMIAERFLLEAERRKAGHARP